MNKLLAVGALSLMGVTGAFAGDRHTELFNGFEGGSHESVGSHSFAAPEIDPSSAISALTLLCGGLTVMRGRIGKKSQ